MLTIYPACFYKEESTDKRTTYSVIFPDLNYLATQGNSLAEAFEMAVDALAGYISSCKEDGDIIPPPSEMPDIEPYKIAAELDFIPNDCFVSMVYVDVESYARDHF